MQARYLHFLIILFITFFFNFSTAQDSINFAEKQGNYFIKKGYDFLDSNNVDSALVYINKAAEKYKEAKNWGYYIHVLTDITITLYENKRHIEFKKMALETNRESLEFLDNDDPIRARVLNTMSLYFYALGNYEKTVEVSKEMLDLNIKNKADRSDIANSYLTLGNAYKFLGDFENAFSYLNKALDIQKTVDPLSTSVAETYQDIGLVFKLNNQIDSAIYYFELAEKLFRPIQNKDSSIDKKGDNFLSLAELWNEKKNTTIAEKYIAKSLKLPLTQYYQIKREEIKGKIFFSQENYSQAILAFQKGQKSALTYSKRNSPPFVARRYIQLALTYEKLNGLEKSLESYHSGLLALSPSFDQKNALSNPKPNQILDKIDALTILNGKAITFYNIFLKTNDKKYLTASFDTYENASELIKNYRQGILSTESKNDLSQKTSEIYEGAIKVAIKLFNHTNQLEYKESALSFAETNKAQLLLESLNEQTAKNFAGIPETLLEQEKDIKLNIAFLEKGILDNASGDKNLKDMKDDLFNLKQQLENLTSNFEKNYPKYYNLKYRNTISSLSDIQSHLKGTNKTFLEYFVGEEHIYLFIVSADQLNIERIENQNFVRQNVETLRNIINNPPDNNFGIQDYNFFTTTANELYNQLIKPALDKLDTKTKDIVIIPDYYLNYIPFDILLKNPGSSNGSLSPNALEYLFEDFNLSYDYSITLHLKNENRKQRDFENDFIGFAPSFKNIQEVATRTCSEDELYALQCSEREVTDIAALINGKPLIGPAANRASFESEIQGYKIIHLATHACIDEQNSNLNKIFLTDDYLSDLDLYNMELNAELAVLSACNTGSGKLIKGEGVMSLARGFINAGCSSTLISMWSVDDCATSDIMMYFYEGLKDGNSKSEALKKAKSKYLDTVDKSKMHPYYWAAFVPFGDMEAMEIGGKSNWFFYLIPISFLFLLFFFFIKKKKRITSS